MAAQSLSTDKDLRWFRQALQISNLSEAELTEYITLDKGSNSFRLSEKDAPWAGNYFPMQKGGVASRWQQPLKPYPKKTLTRDEVQKLSPDELQKLSPIEKYDILVSSYDFKATRHELENRGPVRVPTPADWEGFCNGMRCAGILLDEPRRSIDVTNAEGIKIRFEPADLKALAGASYFYVEKYAQIGAPTSTGAAESQVSAAVFDLALRYFLALNRKAFLIDSNIGPEIWNESVVGYKRNLAAPQALTPEEKVKYPKATARVRVLLELETLGETEIKDSNVPTKHLVASGKLLTTRSLSYDLFVDATNKILTGQWNNSKISGVDFAWFAAGKGMDEAYVKEGGNRHLKFNTIHKLFKEATTFLACRATFL